MCCCSRSAGIVGKAAAGAGWHRSTRIGIYYLILVLGIRSCGGRADISAPAVTDTLPTVPTEPAVMVAFPPSEDDSTTGTIVRIAKNTAAWARLWWGFPEVVMASGAGGRVIERQYAIPTAQQSPSAAADDRLGAATDVGWVVNPNGSIRAATAVA